MYDEDDRLSKYQELFKELKDWIKELNDQKKPVTTDIILLMML